MTLIIVNVCSPSGTVSRVSLQSLHTDRKTETNTANTCLQLISVSTTVWDYFLSISLAIYPQMFSTGCRSKEPAEWFERFSWKKFLVRRPLGAVIGPSATSAHRQLLFDSPLFH